MQSFFDFCYQFAVKLRCANPALFLSPICRQILSARFLLPIYCFIICEQILSIKRKENENVIGVSLWTFSDRICCQSVDILLKFCLLGNYESTLRNAFVSTRMSTLFACLGGKMMRSCSR